MYGLHCLTADEIVEFSALSGYAADPQTPDPKHQTLIGILGLNRAAEREPERERERVEKRET